MTIPDTEFDPDDNFAQSFDTSADTDAEDTPEALVWQLLLLVNPGDEESALQQFAAYQDALAEAGADAAPVWLLNDVIDWKAGFHVAASDTAAFIDSITELAARWNLRIDWGVEDPGDDDFLEGTDVATLMAIAYDRLREYGYTLWTWNTADGTGDGDTHAGWISLSRDDEAMQAVAAELGIELRTGSDAF
jgi:hypothetical protein